MVEADDPYNSISVNFILETEDPFYEHPDQIFYTVLKVDNKALATYPKVAINLQELQRSTRKSGTYQILTCHCGDPGCVGINAGIQVTHEGDTISWLVTDPLPKRLFTFEKKYYREVVRQALNNFLSFVGRPWDEGEYSVEHLRILPFDYDGWRFVEKARSKRLKASKPDEDT